MKSPVRILLLISSILFLSACGSEDEELSIIGSWEYEIEPGFNMYFFFSNSHAVSAIYDGSFSCYTTYSVAISNISNSSFVVNNTIINYKISDNKLSLDEDPNLYSRSNIDASDLTPCEDPDATGNIAIEVEFDHLPSSLFINHENSDEYHYLAYELQIDFDLDNSGDNTNGDFYLSADYEFDSSLGNEAINFTDIHASVFYAYDHQETESGTSWRARLVFNPTIEVNTQSNTISFNIEKSVHKAFSQFDNSHNLKVAVRYTDENLNTQSDRYPSFGFTDSIDTSNLIDEQGDVSGNYSTDTIVDIVNISVIITD